MVLIETKKVNIKAVTNPVQHSEGVHWQPNTNTLYYVDTFKATAYRYNVPKNSVTSYKFENRDSIGIIIPIKCKPDYFLVGADRYLFEFFWTENTKKTAISPKPKQILLVDEEKPKNQFNDGKCDCQGRLWVGTLTRNDDLTVTSNGGSLFLIKGDDLNNFETKLHQTSISNGLAWSKDNKKFYYIDSLCRTIVCFDFYKDCGRLDNERVVFDLKDHPELAGIPDGMTIDNNDNLWIALFGGNKVIQVNTKTGNLDRTIEMPVTYVTSACFGGPDLSTLYVSTSRLHLDDADVKKEPLAGCVFAIENLGVKGLPANEFILK